MTDRSSEVWVQLATRIPKSLHRAVKLQCVTDGEAVQDFVVAALREKFARDTGRRSRRARDSSRR
jgi:hypothetical protein